MSFFARRWKIIAAVMAVIYFFATIGLWTMLMLPVVGTAVFIAGLYIWFIPGIVFVWTGFFDIHEFGASPNGIAGHIVMFLFYLAIAILISLPFGRRK